MRELVKRSHACIDHEATNHHYFKDIYSILNAAFINFNLYEKIVREAVISEKRLQKNRVEGSAHHLISVMQSAN